MKNRIRTFLALALVAAVALAQMGSVSAASLKSQIQLVVKSDLTGTVGLATPTIPMVLERTLNLADGNGASQARVLWTDSRTIAASTTEDLDLIGGGLTDAFGTAFAPAKIRAIIISAASGNTNNVVVGGDAASVPFLSVVTTTLSIQPGGMLVLTAPAAAGIAVTATTGDIIQVANSGAGTSVTYSIIIIGTAS